MHPLKKSAQIAGAILPWLLIKGAKVPTVPSTLQPATA